MLTCEGSTLQSLKVVEDHTRKEAPACRTMRSISESNQERPLPNVRKIRRFFVLLAFVFDENQGKLKNNEIDYLAFISKA